MIITKEDVYLGKLKCRPKCGSRTSKMFITPDEIARTKLCPHSNGSTDSFMDQQGFRGSILKFTGDSVEFLQNSLSLSERSRFHICSQETTKDLTQEHESESTSWSNDDKPSNLEIDSYSLVSNNVCVERSSNSPHLQLNSEINQKTYFSNNEFPMEHFNSCEGLFKEKILLSTEKITRIVQATEQIPCSFEIYDQQEENDQATMLEKEYTQPVSTNFDVSRRGGPLIVNYVVVDQTGTNMGKKDDRPSTSKNAKLTSQPVPTYNKSNNLEHKNCAYNPQHPKTCDNLDCGKKSNPQVPIQNSHSVRYAPYLDSENLNYQNKTTIGPSQSDSVEAIVRHFVIDGAPHSSSLSSNLYLQPPYFGCNEDCTSSYEVFRKHAGKNADISFSAENNPAVPQVCDCKLPRDVTPTNSASMPLDSGSSFENRPCKQCTYKTHGMKHKGIPIKHEYYYYPQAPTKQPAKENKVGTCRCTRSADSHNFDRRFAGDNFTTSKYNETNKCKADVRGTAQPTKRQLEDPYLTRYPRSNAATNTEKQKTKWRFCMSDKVEKNDSSDHPAEDLRCEMKQELNHREVEYHRDLSPKGSGTCKCEFVPKPHYESELGRDRTTTGFGEPYPNTEGGSCYPKSYEPNRCNEDVKITSKPSKKQLYCYCGPRGPCKQTYPSDIGNTKTKNCTICRSDKVDQDELGYHTCYEPNTRNEDIRMTSTPSKKQLYCYCGPRGPCKQTYPSNVEKTQKRSCSICRSGKVDQDELDYPPECYCSETKHGVYSCEVKYERYEPPKTTQCEIHPNQHYRNQPYRDNNTTMGPKPYQNKTVLPESNTIACEALSYNQEYDIGRNITIQIIPNRGLNKSSSEPGVSECRKTTEHINTQNSGCNHKCHKNPRDEYLMKRFESMPAPCSNNLGMFFQEPSRGQCEIKDPQLNRWWSCNWLRKKQDYPYYRNPNCEVPQNGTTTVDQCCQRVMPISTDCRVVSVPDCQVITVPECQRAVPCRNIYQRNESSLKTLKFRKKIIQELFATPSPSSAQACSAKCPQKIRGAPFAICASPVSTDYSWQPATVTQGCQFQPVSTSTETDNYEVTSARILTEVLKNLTKKVPRFEEEDSDEYEDDDEVPDYYPSYNHCCCCCRRPPKCYCCCRKRKVEKPKIEEKPEKNCCTRSVEAKQTLKNCATNVSNNCFTKNQTCCANTEECPKPNKKPVKRKRKCCCCCRSPPTRCCPCCYEENPSCCCWCDHTTYYCQCEHKIPFRQSNPEIPPTESKERLLKKLIKELIVTTTNPVTVETKNVGTGDCPIVRLCQFGKDKLEVKSTNSTTSDKLSIRDDELLKNVTLDLCNLGDKTFSKFGVPSRYYPWNSNTFLTNMPNEVYRFIESEAPHTLTTERIHDPTPCLKPEILSVECLKSAKQLEMMKVSDDIKSPDASGDIEETGTKNLSLSTICGALFTSEKNECGYQTVIDLDWVPSGNNNFLNDSKLFGSNMSNSAIESSGASKSEAKKLTGECQKEEMQKPDENTKLIKQKTPIPKEDSKPNDEKTQKLADDNIIEHKNITKKNKGEKKIPSKINSEKTQIKKESTTKTIPNTSTTAIKPNDAVKPFTTRTGLMSYVPSFRTSKILKSARLNKIKPKSPLQNAKQLQIKNTKSPLKSNIEENTKIGTINTELTKNSTIQCELELTNSVQNTTTSTDTTREEIERYDINSVNGLTKDSSVNVKMPTEDNITSQEIVVGETSIKSDHTGLNIKQDNPLFKKFDQEIYSFCNKCNVEKEDVPTSHFNRSVSDIVKSLESKQSSNNSLFSNTFLNSLLGPRANYLESHNDSTLRDFLFDDSCVECSSMEHEYDVFYGNSFKRSFEDIAIPHKIMSKSDLVSLN